MHVSCSFHSAPLRVLNSKEQTPECIVISPWRMSEAIPTIAHEFPIMSFRTGQTPALHSDMSLLPVVLAMVWVFLLLSCLSEE